MNFMVTFPRHFLRFLSIFLSSLILWSCSNIPQISAEERIFVDLNLEFLGEYQLPKLTFQDTPVGGLSGLTYNPKTNEYYAISDDRSSLAPARFYTLKLDIKEDDQNNEYLSKVNVTGVTILKNEQGQPYPKGTIDTEAIALSPRDTLFISSEGDNEKSIPPFIGEFDLQTGQLKQYLTLPQRFIPDKKPPEQTQGIINNQGFESLTLNPNSLIPQDPFRLFTMPENSLKQDKSIQEVEGRLRLLHYVINPIGDPNLVAEHLYETEPIESQDFKTGVSEMLAIFPEGYFITLERGVSWLGVQAKLFQMTVNNATDTSLIKSLKGNINNVQPVRKKLLLDLSTLGIELDNLEGMTLGKTLKDGSRLLVLVSDDNFNKNQVTQFLAFRLPRIKN